MQTKPCLQPSKVAIRGLLGSPAKPMGTIELPVSYKGKMYQLNCEVLDGYNVPNLLSESDSVRMNPIKRIDHTEIDDRGIDGAKAIMKRYDDVFQGVGKIPGKYYLHIDPNAKPVAHPSRTIPAPLREPARQKLNQLVDMGILEKVPVVNKKSLGPQRDVRITIDPQDLNRALLREHHPMSTIEEITTRIDGSKCFTVLDANMGYFQIELTEESQALTTFNTPFGRYKYLRLPMGISVAPDIYQRAMSELLAGLAGVEVIMDDILIHAPTTEMHNMRLQ